VNFFNPSILQAAQNGGGSAGARDIVNAFGATDAGIGKLSRQAWYAVARRCDLCLPQRPPR
jgi:hypothetical protein